MTARVAARLVAFALASLVYVVGSHWLMTQTQASAWNVVGVLSPMLVIVALGAWRGGNRWLGGCAALVLAGLCVLALMGVQVSSHGLYLAQHAGINFFLALFFGSTLRAGHTPLITTVALRVHGGRLVPGQEVYTRRLTLAWVIFFSAIVLVSLGLYAFASFDTWAVFANLVTPVAIGLMFGGEFLLRFRLHPEFERSSMADAVRAYMHNASAPAGGKPAP
jgi:uncharacterized membrane protein